MARKRKRRNGIVEIGTGPARVKIYTANRSILTAVKTVEEVAGEFIESRRTSGVSDDCVRACKINLKRFCRSVTGNIDEVTAPDLNR